MEARTFAFSHCFRGLELTAILIAVLKFFFSDWFIRPVNDYLHIVGTVGFFSFILFWVGIIMPRKGDVIYVNSELVKILLLIILVTGISWLSVFNLDLGEALTVLMTSATSFCIFWWITLLVADQRIEKNEVPS